jgi:hypothetical protein
MKMIIKRIVFFSVFLSLGVHMVAAALPAEEQKLTYKETVWARQDDDGRIVVVSDGVFRRGENVNLVLRDVGPFQKGTDGKHRFDIDMLVKDPSGKTVLEQKGLLGENGHRLLENDIASSPYGIFNTHVGLAPGIYQMTLTISDKIGGAQVVVTKPFILSPGLSYQKALFAKKGMDNKLAPVADAIFQRGEAVNFVLLNVGTFKKGADGKHAFDIDMQVMGPTGNLVFEQKNLLAEKGHTVLDQDIAESPYGIFYTSVEMEPGQYLMKLSIRDKIAADTLNVTKPFALK